MKVISTPKFLSYCIWINVYESIHLISNIKANSISSIVNYKKYENAQMKVTTWRYAIYHWILQQPKPEIDAIHKAEVCGWFCNVVSIWTWSLSFSTTVVPLNRAPKYMSVVGYKYHFETSNVHQCYNFIGSIRCTV